MFIRFLWIVAGIFLLPALVESAAIIQKVSGIPPAFEQNRGQAPAPARYLLRSQGYDRGLYLTPDSVFISPIQVGFRFVSASASVTETASEPLPGVVNVFRGSDASSWQTGVPRYGRVEFQQIYPGISVAYTIREKQLVCQLTLAPGADLNAVKLEALGVKSIDGTSTQMNLRFSRMTVYFLDGLTAYVAGSSERVSVPARFLLTNGNTFQIEMDAPGPESRREIEFTVRRSSIDQSNFRDAVAGPSGSIYVAGSVAALGVGPASTNEGLEPALEICQWDGILSPTPCSDGFVAKFTAAGELAWISYFHGVRGEVVSHLKLDSKENIYVAGGTDSNDFPVTAGALQTSYAGPTPPFPTTVSSQDVSGDIFLARLNPADGRLVFSTFLGGPEAEWASNLRVDAAGNAYVFGPGASGTPVTAGAMRATPSCPRCNVDYVAKVDPSGAHLIYATYLEAGPMAADVDAAGSVYFAGTANAGELRPTADAYQTIPAENGDGFVAKLTKDGTALDYATYIGGVDYDYASDLVVDSQGSAWAFVVTWINSQCCGNSRYRLVKLDSRGSRILVESNGAEVPLIVDAQDNLWVYAWPPSPALAPTSDALLAKDCGQGMIAKLTSDWRLLFATYPAKSIYSLDANGAPLLRTSPGVAVLDLSAPAPPVLGCVVNAASWADSDIAPGQIVTLFGKGLGPEQGVAYTLGNDGRLGTSLAGTRVLFDGVAAPLLYAQAEQVNAIVPFGMKTDSLVAVAVEYQGQAVATKSMGARRSAFAFFTLDGSGKGQAAAFNQDGTLNSPTNPARLGSVVSLWGTGAGQTTPASVDGAITGSDLPRVQATVKLGVTPAEILYAGAAPGMVAGVTQVNIRIPSDYSDTRFPLTALRVSVTVGGSTGIAFATIAVK